MEETLPRTISVTSGGLKLEFARDTFNDFDDIDAKLGTGFGIRWRSPVGLYLQ